MMFHNADKAKGYAYAQHEIDGARALAAADRLQASVAANRAAAANHALAHTVDTLHAALAAETERAAFFQAEADKLAATLADILPSYERLMAENATLKENLAGAYANIRSKLDEMPPKDVGF